MINTPFNTPVVVESDSARVGRQLIETERRTVEAFQAKRDSDFTRHFAPGYIGVANDGLKTTADELKGMHALELSALRVEEENVTFPADDVALLTYKMIVEGRRGDVKIDGSIMASTVYVKRDDAWLVVLHTESLGTP
jgi:hypothetical protein